MPTFGLATTDQVDPSQNSTRLRSVDTPSVTLLVASPTAHTVFVPGTVATACKELSTLVFGLATTDHAAPSQRTIRVILLDPLVAEPTAHTSFAARMATPSSTLPVPTGTELRDQPDPFQCSARPRRLKSLNSARPTAHASPVVRAATAVNPVERC